MQYKQTMVLTFSYTFDYDRDGGFEAALAKLRSHIPLEHHDTVIALIGDWYEAALDDLFFRVYKFAAGMGRLPEEYLAEARRRGIYTPVTYEYAATYPLVGRIEANFTF